MPKQTFLNLPQEKQRRLLKAGFEEFSRVPAIDASISNIIKLAEIPRGSFYQYFEDKYDLQAYLVMQFSQEWYRTWRQLLQEHQGDFFAAVPLLFKDILDMMRDEKNHAFWKNTFFQFRNSKEMRKALHQQRRSKHGDDRELINQQKLRIELTEHNYVLLNRQITTMMIQSISMYFMADRFNVDDPYQEAIQNFNTLLNWLQFGIQGKGGNADD